MHLRAASAHENKEWLFPRARSLQCDNGVDGEYCDLQIVICFVVLAVNTALSHRQDRALIAVALSSMCLAGATS